jgi:subtilisin
VNADGAQTEGHRGKDIKVAVIDTGVGEHPDLRVRGGKNFTKVGNVDDYTDISGHGTHVAGIIAANNQSGLIGIAPDSELYSARVFTRSKTLTAANKDIGDAILWAAGEEIQSDIINLSIQGDKFDDFLKDRIEYVTNERGVFCIAAGGNSGSNIMYPAAYDACYCVSALGQLGQYPSDSTHRLREPKEGTFYGENNLYAAKNSCKGPGIDACAPGVAIISTYPPDSYTAHLHTSIIHQQ